MNTDHEQTMGPAMEHNDLGLLFRRAARLMLRGHHHHHGPVHPAQSRVLALLRERSPVSQRLLMEELGVRSGSLSELLAKLERHGLIERTRDEEDKRGFVISLTAHGDALVAEHALRERELSAALFAPLDEEERSQLRALLQKLTDAWERERGGEDCDHPRHGGRHGCCRHGRDHGHHGHGCPDGGHGHHGMRRGEGRGSENGHGEERHEEMRGREGRHTGEPRGRG